MPGLYQNLVTEIARTLRDRYHNGFPILKELIQNADDAKATRIIFGHHEGLGDKTNHSLLKGPALWVFNDGEFKESDAMAIGSFGINTKAGDVTTIGKFGLGMKSVFHLCESFFYVASDSDAKIHQCFLNPWFSDVPKQKTVHNKWEEISDDDWTTIEAIGRQHAGNNNSWFLMLIPLRVKEHKTDDHGNNVGVIVERFPGETDSKELEFLKEKNLEVSLGFILPLLKNLKSIEHLGNEKYPSFHAKIESHDDLRLDHQTPERKIQGIVKGAAGEKNKSEFSIQFNGLQICPTEGSSLRAEFEKLRNLGAWPKSFRLNEHADFEQVGDKSQAEASVVLQVIEGDVGRLSLDWAVFLPIEEGNNSYSIRIPESSRHYRFVLHGQFFVDAGRRGINGYASLSEKQLSENDELGLTVQWNQSIAQSLVLPNLLHALADFVAQGSLTDGEVTKLTTAMEEATSKSGQSFFKNYRNYICQGLSWACIMSETGRSWQLCPTASTQKLLPLPKAPHDEPNRPWNVLPRLNHLKGSIFYDASKPRLSLRGDTWDEHSLITVLGMDDNDVVKVFCSQTGLDYLASFLEQEERRYVGVGSVQEVLFNLIRKAFRLIPLPKIRQNSARFKAVLRFLSADRFVSIGTMDLTAESSIAEDVFSALFNVEASTLLIPRDLAPKYSPTDTLKSQALPNDRDITAWLKCVHELVSSAVEGVSIDKYSITAKNLLGIYPSEEDRAQILLKNRTLKVIKAQCIRSSRSLVFSLEQLHALLRCGNIFSSSNYHDKFGLAGLLSEVFPEEQLLFVDAETGRILRSDNAPALLNSGSTTDILKSIGCTQPAKKLGHRNARVELIKKAFHGCTDLESRKGLRYLLHGDPEQFNNMQSPLWVESSQNNSAWTKLWRMLQKETWNVLANDLASQIPPATWDVIGMKSVIPQEIIEKLVQIKDFSIVTPNEFTFAERDSILGTITEQTLWNDIPLWCAIPLHQFIDGQFGSITSQTFLKTEREVPAELKDYCQIVESSNDSYHSQKQRQFLRKFNSTAIIDTALNLEKPVNAWQLILEELVKIEGIQLEPSLLKKLRHRPWIPLQNGSAIQPADIIDVPALAEHINELAVRVNYDYCGIAALSQQFQEHRGFSLATQLFTSGETAAEPIGHLLARDSTFHLGNIEPLAEQELQSMISYLVGLKLPGWVFIRDCIPVFDEATICTKIIPKILRPISVDQITCALQHLLAETSNEYGYVKTYCRYLAIYPSFGKPEALQQLRSLKLLTNAGIWKSATELCYGSIGLDKSYVLNSDFAKTLGDLLIRVGTNQNNHEETEPETQEFEQLVHSTPEVIRAYFTPWQNLVRPGIVGAFMAFLGAQLRQQAETWLQPHSADWLYDNIDWQIPGLRNDGTGEWMQGQLAQQAFKLLKVGVRIINGQHVDVPNIFGDTISVPLTEHIENLVAGGFYWKGGYNVEVRLRQLPELTSSSATELSDLLKRSSTYILQHAYSQKNADLNKLWDRLAESDQLDLSVARALILDNLPLVLRDQIGAHKNNPQLADVLNTYDLARRAKTEYEQAGGQPHDNLEVINRVKESLLRLSQLLTENTDVQLAVLSAVRKKLKNYQYDISGILFELFQNADDALVELEKINQDLHGDSYTPIDAPSFVVDVSKDAIRAIHWGRPINYCPPAVEDSRANEFRRDLEKMLILSSSDKSQDSGVTGKFGLGFKSVLLASDSPKVLSGDLRFEIVGGVLPMPWQSADDAVTVLNKYSADHKPRGTLTELSVRNPEDHNRMLERFSMLCSLQSIFGRSIRQIKIINSDKPVPSGRWIADKQFGKFELGFSELPNNSGWSQTRLLVFRGTTGCIALKLSSKGFEKIDRNTPPIWVTAPTRESESIGFIVNGAFEVDAGRSRLASNSALNQHLAVAIGREFGSELQHLFEDCRKDWSSVRNTLKLADDVQQVDFWSSLWRTIYPKTDDSDALVHQIAKSIAAEAIQRGIQPRKLIPNGLKGRFARAVDLDLTLAAIPTSWRADEILNKICTWPLFEKKYPTSTWIADDIASIVNDIFDKNIQKLTIKDIIKCIGNEPNCDAGSATFFHYINSNLIENLSWSERDEIKNSFNSLQFKTKKESWCSPTKLILTNSDSLDEQLLCEFAPQDYVLSQDYFDDAINFFKYCRRKLDLSDRDIADFVIAASSDTSRRAALLFLAKGQRSRNIAACLRGLLPGTWLENLDAYKRLILDEDWLEIVIRLKPQSIIYQENTEPQPDEIWDIDGSEKLKLIAKWWEEQGRDSHIKRYEEHFWPANVSKNFSADPIDRRAWMTLFGLGLTQRMGRVKDSQHRGFIESLDSKGWWDVFCTIDPQQGSNQWFKVLNEYGEKQIDNEEFGLWMDNFARLYRIARWLDVYVHVFRTIDQREYNEFGRLLNPATDPIFQGDAEIAAPSVERSLKKGQHLIIRELLRSEILKSEHAKRRAFIPSLSVRKFFTTLGFAEPKTSEEIYQILHDSGIDPTFGGDFDIPLRIVAHNNLLEQILWE